MRLLTFHLRDSIARLGIRADAHVLDLNHAARIANQPVPSSMRQLLAGGEKSMASVRELGAIASRERSRFAAAWHDLAAVTYLPPITDADKFRCVGTGAEMARGLSPCADLCAVALMRPHY